MKKKTNKLVCRLSENKKITLTWIRRSVIETKVLIVVTLQAQPKNILNLSWVWHENDFEYTTIPSGQGKLSSLFRSFHAN